jgi:hypothetical protein
MHNLSDRKQFIKSLRLADYSFESTGVSAVWIDKNAHIEFDGQEYKLT